MDNQNVDIMNHSWGGPQYKTIIRQAFAYAYKMNTVNSVAMGNDFNNGNPTNFPAAFGQGIIAVGGTQNNDVKSPFSQTGNHIDVVAPGGFNIYPSNNSRDILSTWENDGVRYVAGTSMATPQITGIASLLKGYNSSLYNDDIEHLIQLSAEDRGPTGFDPEYGHGRVNAHQALLRLQSPYVLNHHTATGGTVTNVTQETKLFYDTPGLANGVYVVKRNEVRKTVSFPWMSEVHVWGRGVATNGYSNANPNFAMGWNDAVSVSNNSATLKTYVYEVFTTSGQRVGWFPTSPSNATFAYTVHGKPGTPPLSVNITGPSTVIAPGTYLYQAAGSGGVTPYENYYWYKREGFGSWSYLGTGTTKNVYFGTPPIDSEVKVVLEDGSLTYAEDIAYVFPTTCTSDPCEGEGESLQFKAPQNHPNPFNPVTKIEYALPERAQVSVKIYNIMGQEVATLIDGVVDAGSKELSFDANRLSSGVYFARIFAIGNSGNQYQHTLKMHLVK